MHRRLRANEESEARQIFADSLNYQKIWIYENTSFPNWIGKLGAIIRKEAFPTKNAVCLGQRLYFPVILKTTADDISSLRLEDIGWLIHELTHAWQYQHFGLRYLFSAIKAWISLGSDVYDFGSEKGLQDAYQKGKHFIQFNPEQQAEIVRTYYFRMKKAEDISAWESFIEDIKSTANRASEEVG